MITKDDLKRSVVVFNEEAHTYHRGEQELSGITGLIHSVLQLGVYPDANTYVKEVAIPKAGYYGSCVHKSIQLWDDLGVENTQFPAKKHHTDHCGDVMFDAQDVSADLASYRRTMPKGCRALASEFTVDYGNFASQIDKIWVTAKGDIYLVDFKTNNLETYPGGKEALKLYLSWQLSCYAVMFEHQTGLKVKGLIGKWLRHGQEEQWKIKRQPDNKVIQLLDSEVMKTDNGWAYFNPDMQVVSKNAPEPQVAQAEDLVVPKEITNQLLQVTQAIADIKRQEEEANRRCDELKAKLKEAMEKAGVKSWDAGLFKATIKAAGTRRTFDSKRFQAEHADLAKDYIKETQTKSSILITLKK